MFDDVDWLAVRLEAGKTYDFDVDGRLLLTELSVEIESMDDLFDPDTGFPAYHSGNFSLEGLYDAGNAQVVAGSDAFSAPTRPP